MWYGGAHGGLYETLTSLVYFALLAKLHYLRPTWCATSDAIRSPHMPHLPDALLPPCSLPAALAYLTLSFPDAVYPVSVFSTPL